MGRMHSNGKGMADSALPYKRTPPSWLKTTSTEVTEHVTKLAKKGLMPSQVSFLWLLCGMNRMRYVLYIPQLLLLLCLLFILTLPSPYTYLLFSFRSDWRYPPRQPRCCSGEERDGTENFASAESQWPCTHTSWGLVPFDQEGRVYAKALGEKP